VWEAMEIIGIVSGSSLLVFPAPAKSK